jgi:membrane-associated phospholipid phosphatase
MRLDICGLLLAIFLIPLTAIGAEQPYDFGQEVSGAAGRLAGEAKALVQAPFSSPGSLLGTLAVAGAVGLTAAYDTDIRDHLRDSRSSRLESATDAGSLLGNPFLHLGVAAAVYGGGVVAESSRYKQLGEMLGEAVLLADAATLVTKQVVGRARPLTGRSAGSFRPFAFASDYDSLPSMHTASSFAMASVMAAASESTIVRLGCYGAAAFVGFSRMYQDKHWASDVVLGAAIGELAGQVVTRYHTSGKARLAIVPLAGSDRLSLAITGRF